MAELLNIDRDRLAGFCHDRGIRQLSLFGSRARGEARRESDVDLLVEFEVGTVPTLLDMAAMEAELSSMLNGLKVDLRTRHDLSRYFREDVVRAAEVQFVAA